MNEFDQRQTRVDKSIRHKPVISLRKASLLDFIWNSERKKDWDLCDIDRIPVRKYTFDYCMRHLISNNQAETNTKTHPLTHTAEGRDCLYKYNNEPEIMDGLEHLAEEEIEEEEETSRV